MITGIVLTLVCVAYRVVLGCYGSGEWWFNFDPISAIVLCSAIFLPRRAAFALPFSALFISDLFLNVHYGVPVVSSEMGMRYLALLAIAGVGFVLRRTTKRGMVLGVSLVASVWFYFVTNTVSWIADPAYVKTFCGWEQALTTGVPGYPPTWLFLRNSVLSDLLFTGLFLACMSFKTAKKPAALYPQFVEQSGLGSSKWLKPIE